MLERWNDDRLDDLQYRVSRAEAAIEVVARLEERLESNSRELKRNTVATEHVARQLEAAKVEPLTRSRNLRHQLYIAVGAAVTGGAFVVIGALLSGHP